MAALGWLLNLDFAIGDGGAAPAATVFLEGVLDGQSVSIDGSVREDRYSVGSEGVRVRRQLD